jgi:hypothetical protein
MDDTGSTVLEKVINRSEVIATITQFIPPTHDPASGAVGLIYKLREAIAD